jgi:Kef-type K+ transport system membrane component KefB/K+/H+ antiporter YhaU regulatory subunit KhtT
MHNELIQDLASMLLTGGIFGWIFKRLFKLPLILGYMFAGILISLPIPYTPMVVKPHDAHSLAEIGVLLLLFSMGLHFGVRKIKSLGFKAVSVGIAESLAMWMSASLIASAFHIQSQKAVFLGAVFAVSSTVVIIKTLEDFELKSARFAEKIMGVLLVEDSVAIFIIIWLSTASSVGGNGNSSLSLIHLAFLFMGSIFLWWLLGTILVPRIIRSAFLAGKEELLVILSIGFALGLAYLSASWEFSSALGAFIMGSILSECREIRKIEALIEPIKNLFGLIFFVSVGLLFSPAIIIEEWKFILLFTIVTIVGKIFYNLIFNLIAGQGMKDSIRMAGSMGQIGELSFVIAQVAKATNAIDEKIFSAIIVIAIVTMLSSPFIMKSSLAIADRSESLFPPKLNRFIDIYSQFMFGFSVKKIELQGKKISFLSKFKLLFRQAKEKIKINYLKVTSANVTSTLDRLAPWDEYLVPVHVEGNTAITGKNLVDLKLRENFNINVVAIEREMQTIISPKPTDVIMNGDTLLVYGTEDSVIKLEHFCSKQLEISTTATIDECSLANIILESALHPFVGRNIIDLGIRETYNCIVLAVNRKDERIKNPISSFTFHIGDEIYLFGTKKSLLKIKKLFT